MNIDKIFIRGILIFGTFIGAWFLLSQVDWLGTFFPNLSKEDISIKAIETKLGAIMLEEFTREDALIEDEFLNETIDSLVVNICTSNAIEKQTLKVYLIDNQEVNAFALPNRQLIIYTGLIKETPNPEALSGVIAHELAHIEKNHVMKSLRREFGFGVLMALISGNSNISVITNIAKLLSSSAFSREMEREADLTGVAYLQKANVNPRFFAEFMGVLQTADFSAYKWISTHPMPDTRKKDILQHIDNQRDSYQEIISKETWATLKNRIVE